MRKFLSLHRFCAMLFALGIISLATTSCGGGKGGDKPSPTPTTETLSVNPATLTLAGGASGTINITSNVAWTVSASTGYTVSPTNGSNNGTVKVTASASATGGTVTIKGKSKTASVTISSSAVLTVEPESISIPSTAGNGTFAINCSGTWNIIIPNPKPAWLSSVSPSSGTGNSTITVTTSTNSKKTKESTFLTIKSGSNSKYFTIIKEAAPNNPPTKPTGLKPTGGGIETITTFSWNASTDPDAGDKIKYTIMLSKDGGANWTSLETTEKTSVMNKTELDKNTPYQYKVIADDGYEGGKVESDVVTFTTGSTKSYWTDGEVKLYEVNADGSITEVPSTSRPFKLIYTGDGYTQDLFNYGGQFDKETEAGVKALFEIEPYKTYYSYFAIYKVAAYSNEAGMSQGSTTGKPGSTDWDQAVIKLDTKFRCTWAGGNSTAIDCNENTVVEYASKVPGMTTMAALTASPISIIINADQYAGTNKWRGSESWGQWKVLSIAQTPARHPSSSQYGGFAYTLRHEFGGHGIGLLGDEYINYGNETVPYPQDNEDGFRWWQDKMGCSYNIYLPEWNSTDKSWYSDYNHCNLGLTPTVEEANWKTFAENTEYAPCNINLHRGGSYYGVGIYRSENSSCMINNIPHYNTFSRWRIYCRIKITAGETPSVEDFIANDHDKTNSYGSAAPSTKAATPPVRRCEGPLLSDPYHKKPYRLK